MLVLLPVVTVADSSRVVAGNEEKTSDNRFEACYLAKWVGYSSLDFFEYDPHAVFVKMKRGINFEGLEDYRKYNSYIFEAETYENIAAQGFDHIRLPVDFRHYADADGKMDKLYPELDKILEMAEKNDLAILLDCHSWYDFNMAKGDDALFYKMWENIAEYYKDYDYTMLAFELMNEPHTTEGGDLDMENLNTLQREAVKRIRNISPKRTIVLATAEWNGPWTLMKFNLTEFDNVFVSVHTYEPLDFTHQGMAWMGTQDVKLSLTDEMLKNLQIQLSLISMFKKRTKLPVLLSEFGLNSSGHIPDDEVTKYLSHIVNYAEANSISWSYWAYNGSFSAYRFGFFGMGAGWRKPVMDALMPKQK
jgi:endoglucanase